MAALFDAANANNICYDKHQSLVKFYTEVKESVEK